MNHLMIDLETLGTTADSVIMSLGAVKFDLESEAIDPDGFYGSISIESNMDAGRRISEDTMIWWLKQSAAAQQVFHEEKLSLSQTLEEFSDWLSHDKWVVWSNGASFDIPMLEHAYKTHGMNPPWEFWNSRCVRTYKALPGAKNIGAKDEGVAHNALNDAYKQAKTVQMIHQAVFMPKPTKAKAKT